MVEIYAHCVPNEFLPYNVFHILEHDQRFVRVILFVEKECTHVISIEGM